MPLEFTSVGQHHSSRPSASEVPPIESSCTPLAATAPSANPLLTFDTRPKHAFADTPMPAAISQPSPVSPPANCDASTSRPSSRAPQNTNTTLKPLASFFDQFLQTARVETQLERTKKRRVPHKNQTSHYPNQVNAPQPVGTLKSFLRNAVRKTSSAHRSAHASYPIHRLSPSYSSNAFTIPNHVGLPPSMTTQFRVPSSPDRAFQPTPYQVVLPSTPPTDSRSRFYATPGHDLDLTLDAAVDSSVNLFCFHNRACECFACSLSV